MNDRESIARYIEAHAAKLRRHDADAAAHLDAMASNIRAKLDLTEEPAALAA